MFALFLKSTSNFKHFKKTMIVIAYVFPKLWTVKDVGKKMSKKPSFRTPLDSQKAKGPQAMLKSARQLIDHIFLTFCAKWS